MLAGEALWENETPGWAKQRWGEFKRFLLDLDPDWRVWTDWYEARLVGRSTYPNATAEKNEQIEFDRATIEDKIWDEGPAAVNAEIKRLEKEILGEGWDADAGYGDGDSGYGDGSEPPDLPDDRPGARFRETAQNLVEIAPTGQPSEGDDLAALERTRIDVFDALDDLEAAIGQSNAFQFVRPIAEKYRAGLEGPIAEVAFDTVWRRGIRLRAVHVRIQRELQAGELPEPAMDLEEALSSLVAFHGPMVLSTEAGRQQADLAHEDRGEIGEWIENKDKLREFASRARAQPEFLTPETGEEIEEQAAIAGEGPNTARSIEASVALEESLIVYLGNRISSELKTSPISAAANSIALYGSLSPIVKVAVSFLLANADFLIGFSACSSEYLYWVPEYLNWLKRRMGLIA